MTRQTAMIITIATAVVFGCCGLFSCIGGIATLAGGGTMTFGDVTQQTPPAYGIGGICFAILFVAIPVVVWYFLIKRREDDEAMAA